MTTLEIPLFPLRTVLYPGGPLPLRLFEPRYVDMVPRCLREDVPFGVLLISEGSESGRARFCEVGTTARIVDWYQGSDGLLGITAHGERRFRLKNVVQETDGLHVGTVDLMQQPAAQPLADEDRHLANLLERVLQQLGSHYAEIPKHYDDADWVANRLAEVLPVSLELKQRCLVTDEPQQRLALLRDAIEQIKAS